MINFKTSPFPLRVDVINVWSLIGKNFKKGDWRDWRLQRLDLLFLSVARFFICSTK